MCTLDDDHHASKVSTISRPDQRNFGTSCTQTGDLTPNQCFIEHYMQLCIITECRPHVRPSISGVHRASQQGPTQSRRISKLTQLWPRMAGKASPLAPWQGVTTGSLAARYITWLLILFFSFFPLFSLLFFSSLLFSFFPLFPPPLFFSHLNTGSIVPTG